MGRVSQYNSFGCEADDPSTSATRHRCQCIFFSFWLQIFPMISKKKREARDTLRNSFEDLWRSWPTIQGSISFEQLCLATFENWRSWQLQACKQDAAKVQQHPSTLNQVLTLIAKAHYVILDFQWFKDVIMSTVSDPGWSQHDHRDCWAPGRVSSGTIFLLLSMAPFFEEFWVCFNARFVRLLSLPPAPNDPITAGNLSTHQLTKGEINVFFMSEKTPPKAMLQAAQADFYDG